MIGPLYQRVDPHKLGEAGRELQIGEMYAKRVMHRWGYVGREDVDQIVRRLVWDYPTHSFVIDLAEAKEMGLNAEELEEETDGLCRQILKSCDGCVGVFAPNQEIVSTVPTASNKEGDTSDDARPKNSVAKVPADAGRQGPSSSRSPRVPRPAQGESAESEARANAPPNGSEALVAR